MNAIPDLIDNRRCTLSQVLREMIAQSTEPRMDVVTAFFNLKGLEALEPEIQRLVRLRLLLGKEQDAAFVVGERLRAELEYAITRGEASTHEVTRWKAFLESSTVEIREYRETFVHGKAYILHGVPALGSLGIVGSSNFTGAGLAENLELNAVLKQSSAVSELSSWFEALWSRARDYKDELLKTFECFTRSYTPYEIYIKVVYEALRDQLAQDLEEKDGQPSPIALADFQQDGYLAAREILDNYGGVLIADSVGLGKTYLALRLLDDYAYRERQPALIVSPAAVADTVWRPLLRQFAIPHELVTMERISQREFPSDKYAERFQVIVVDESHNFRNPRTNRFSNLLRIITGKNPEKKVILLTATPVNNTVFDLYHQLRLITRDNRRFLLSAGIPDLEEYFRRAEEKQEALYEILEALAVRRSRHFIRTHYPEAEIMGQKIRFPERELHTVRYSLKDTYGPDLYQEIAEAIENLSLAPYQLDTYRLDFIRARKALGEKFQFFGESEEEGEKLIQNLQSVLGWSQEQAQEFVMTIGRQTALAHILRVLYLKRLESSIEALHISLSRLHGFLSLFLQALKKGRLLGSKEYRDYERWLQSFLAEDVDEEGNEKDVEAFLSSLSPLSPSEYDTKSITSAVQDDLARLEKILEKLAQKRADSKLKKLKELLVSPQLVDQKVVIFSYFKDTVRYLYRELIEDRELLSRLGYERERVAIVDSDVSPKERYTIVARFAPMASGNGNALPEERIDILISTDILSEGQNLQDASIVINYDLHWNPVRMVQRVGRLDRIGSPHETIHVYNFFPEEELEELLGLLARLQEKLNAINRTVGLDASILGEVPHPMDFNILRRVKDEDARTLEELEEESELTVGEFLKHDLLRFLKELGEERLRRIPLGVGTVRRGADKNPRGFFAAFRNPASNQHYWLFYDRERERIIERRLEAIQPIRSQPHEEAVPFPEDFDPQPLIKKLRKHLFNRIRAAEVTPEKLPSIQRQIVNWLHALPPSATRNQLLQYFEARALTGPDFNELRNLWRERSKWSPEDWLQRLKDFAESHPHPPAETRPHTFAPSEEKALECIAWMLVV